ncbi:MAG TPA: ATP synthase F0 subunit C [Elusimicrobia bacterium]|nr:ATP synthase F0 subunit C [Elusimicrobiota bacterium]
MFCTAVLFAAEGEGVVAEGVKNLASIPYFVWATAAIAVGFAFTTAVCGLGQGIAIKGGLEGIARQPEASDKIQITMLLGLAFIESLALFALFINIILLFANPFIKYLQ